MPSPHPSHDGGRAHLWHSKLFADAALHLVEEGTNGTSWGYWMAALDQTLIILCVCCMPAALIILCLPDDACRAHWRASASAQGVPGHGQ